MDSRKVSISISKLRSDPMQDLKQSDRASSEAGDDHTSGNRDLLKVASNAGIVAIGSAAHKVLRYLLSLLLTNTLGAGLYGIYVLSLTVTDIFKIFSVMGLNYGMIRYVSIFSGKGDAAKVKGVLAFIIKISSAVSIVLTVALYLSANPIAHGIFGKPMLGGALQLLAFALPCTVVAFVLMAAFKGFQRLKYVVYVENLFTPTVRLALVSVCFVAGWKLYGVLAAVLVSSVLGSMLAFYYLWRLFPEISRASLKGEVERRTVVGYSFPLFLTAFLSVFINRTDILMLGYFAEAENVGIYAIAQRLSHLVFFVSASFIGIFAPMISELHALNQRERLRSLFKTVARWVVTLSLPIFLVLVLFSEPVLRLFGEDFVEGKMILYILCCVTLFNSVIGLSGQIIGMTGRSKLTFINALLAAMLNVLLNLAFIPKYGMVGAAVGTAISIAAVNVARVVEVFYLERMQMLSAAMLKPLLVGSASVALILFVRRYLIIGDGLLDILFYSALFGALYFGTLLMTKLEEEDKQIVMAVRDRIAGRRFALK